MPELPLVGDEFAGYRMRAVLGRGGMSVVYQAENLRLSNVIALKVLAPELAADDVFRARFLEESRIAASLNHPNVIPIYDMGSSNGLPTGSRRPDRTLARRLAARRERRRTGTPGAARPATYMRPTTPRRAASPPHRHPGLASPGAASRAQVLPATTSPVPGSTAAGPSPPTAVNTVLLRRASPVSPRARRRPRAGRGDSTGTGSRAGSRYWRPWSWWWRAWAPGPA